MKNIVIKLLVEHPATHRNYLMLHISCDIPLDKFFNRSLGRYGR